MQVFENGFHVVALPRVSIASYTCLLHSMTPEAQKLWRAPQWAFSILLALLGMLGPFSIDTYLPAFAGISQSLGATPVQMQQTLSAYLFRLRLHGAVSWLHFRQLRPAPGQCCGGWQRSPLPRSGVRCRKPSASSSSSGPCRVCVPVRAL